MSWKRSVTAAAAGRSTLQAVRATARASSTVRASGSGSQEPHPGRPHRRGRPPRRGHGPQAAQEGLYRPHGQEGDTHSYEIYNAIKCATPKPRLCTRRRHSESPPEVGAAVIPSAVAQHDRPTSRTPPWGGQPASAVHHNPGRYSPRPVRRPRHRAGPGLQVTQKRGSETRTQCPDP